MYNLRTYPFKVLSLSLGVLLYLTSCFPQRKTRFPDSPPMKAVELKLNEKKADYQELLALQKIRYSTDIIQAGDVFDFSIYNEPDLSSSSAMVSPGGSLALKLIGDVQVGGMTYAQARTLIREKYRFYLKNPLITLSPVRLSPRTYSVLGAVKQPGNFNLDGHRDLRQALGLAGGFLSSQSQTSISSLADLKHALFVRNGQAIPVDFEALLSGKPLHNIPVLPGDYIYIPSVSQSRVYILGDVLEQEAISYVQGMTLSQVLTSAKGFKSGANLGQIQLVRGRLNQPDLYVIDYQSILNGERPDIVIEPEDLIYVSQSPAKQWSELLGNILPTLQLLQSGLLFYEIFRNPDP